MKKKLFLLLAAVMLCSLVSFPAVAAAEPIMRVSRAEAKPGEEADITVSLENNPGIVGMTLGFSYSEELELISITQSGLGGIWQKGTKVAWASSEGDTSYNGVFLTLRFKVADTATAGNAAVSITYSAGDICNDALEDVSFTIVPGGVAIGTVGETPLNQEAPAAQEIPAAQEVPAVQNAVTSESSASNSPEGEQELPEGEQRGVSEPETGGAKGSGIIWVVLCLFAAVSAVVFWVLRRRRGR